MKNKTHSAGPRFLTDSPAGLAVLLLALLLSAQAFSCAQEGQAALLAPGVLRLHILADSDAPADQAVKLRVRSFVLDWFSERQGAVQSKADALRLLKRRGAELTGAIGRQLSEEGVPCRVSLSLTRCYFPTRSYGRAVFPCGFYDAARIRLGSGRGHNWWCVLYPGLCLTEEAWDVSPAPEPPAAGAEPAGSADAKKEEPPALTGIPPSVTFSLRLLPKLRLSVPASAAKDRLLLPAFGTGGAQDAGSSPRPPAL